MNIVVDNFPYMVHTVLIKDDTNLALGKLNWFELIYLCYMQNRKASSTENINYAWAWQLF